MIKGMKKGDIIEVRHAKQHELKDLEEQGFQVDPHLHHPVMRAYGSAYAWRKPKKDKKP